MKYETKRQATEAWVNGFNAIPLDFVVKGVTNRNDQGIEGFFFDEVDVLATPEIECSDCGTLQSSSNATCEDCGADLSETGTQSYELPMWGTVWTFGERIDEEWARDNSEILAEHGFHVYDHDDLGVFIGIDGAGYDFYEAHWTPLYDARGIQWHK